MKRRSVGKLAEEDSLNIILEWALEADDDLDAVQIGYYMLALAISISCKKVWRDNECRECVLAKFSWVCPRVEYC